MVLCESQLSENTVFKILGFNMQLLLLAFLSEHRGKKQWVLHVPKLISKSRAYKWPWSNGLCSTERINLMPQAIKWSLYLTNSLLARNCTHSTEPKHAKFGEFLYNNSVTEQISREIHKLITTNSLTASFAYHYFMQYTAGRRKKKKKKKKLQSSTFCLNSKLLESN